MHEHTPWCAFRFPNAVSLDLAAPNVANTVDDRHANDNIVDGALAVDATIPPFLLFRIRSPTKSLTPRSAQSNSVITANYKQQ